MNKRIIKKRLVLKKNIKKVINKFLLSVILLLIGMIIIKNNPKIKPLLIENIFEKSIKFSKTKQVYEKYFGNILSLDKVIKETEPVFNEKLSYNKIEKYKDGVKLEVNNNYLVPNIESGIVVYIGVKEDLGNTVIIDQINGVETLYSNININNYKLYDYIEKGEVLGEVKDNNLYISFKKDGKYLDYKEYI